MAPVSTHRKAAGEMRERLLSALQAARRQPTPPEAEYQRQTWQLARAALENDQQQQWHLLDNPNRLQILTIDAFCATLTRQLPLQAGFGLQPEIAPDAEALYRRAVQQLLEQLESDEAVSKPLGELLLHLDNDLDRIEPLLVSMLARREQWLPLIGSGDQIQQARPKLERALGQLLDDELGQLNRLLQPYSSTLLMLADYAASNLIAAGKQSLIRGCLGLVELPQCSAEQLPLWCALAELLLTQQGQWRKSVTVANGFPAGTSKTEKERCKARKDELKDLIAELAEQPEILPRLQRLTLLPQDRYQDSQWQILDALTRILPNLVAQLWLCFARESQVDYSQVTSAALQALGDEDEPTDLALQLDYRISHILVDEFQDTASPQIQLLTKLTHGWQQGDGRTLFIVGDGMQSCYGFRDANVGLFLEARRHGIGSIRLDTADLCVNFRSQQRIVDWVNQTFALAFPAEDDISRGAVSYSPSTPFNPPLEDNAIRLIGLFDYPDSRSRARAEAQYVVEQVRHCRSIDPEGSIAILVRNRPHLREILPALRQAGLSWQATDLDPLATRMWVVDLISLARALANPADRIAWLALLRAPWCGLDNADLLTLAGGKQLEVPIWSRIRQLIDEPQLSDSGQRRLQRLYQVLDTTWAHRLRRPLRDSVELCWLKLGGAAALDAAQRRDIDKTLTLFEQFDKAGQLLDWDGFERALSKLYAQPASDADSRLQIMTIHKSKGLEFDSVILTGLDRRPRAADKPLLQWQLRLDSQGHEELLLAPLAARDQEQESIYRYLSSEAEQRDQMESTRLLYVGATRAIKRLIMTANLRADKQGNPATPAKNSLLATIWPQVSEQFELHPAPASLNSEPTRQVLQQIERITEGWQPTFPADEQLLPEPSTAVANPDASTEDDLNRPEPDWLGPPRLAGTLVHQILKRLAEQPLPIDCKAWCVQQAPSWRLQLQQLGLAQDHLEQGLARVERLIRNCLEDQRGRWLLDYSHQQSACELPISFDNGSRTQHWVVDRTFIDASGQRWIIDYKTASCPAEFSFDDFIEQECQRYRPQLSNYARAFAAMETASIRCALYFPESLHFIELDLNAAS